MDERPPNKQDPQGPAPAALVRRMLNDYVETQLLYVAVALGLADLLHDEPRGVDELACATSADCDALRRVLRGLANSGIVDEGEDGRFALTELGEPLRADAPGSLRALVLLTGEQEYRAWGELLGATRTGQTAFERAYGEPFFARLDRDPAIGAHFGAFMDRASARLAAALPAAYDFSAIRSVVDVGGGRGTLLTALLLAYPYLHGTLFERDTVLSDIPRTLVTTGVATRCRVVAGDFFQAVPAGGDLYILSQVLHDWDDARAPLVSGWSLLCTTR